MKRIISIFLLFICLSINYIKAEGWDSLFVAANEAYQKKDFPLCVMLLDSIHHQGYGSENTYFNLGNAYYKLKNYPFAILNYERAARLAPYQQDIAQNLHLANKQLPEKISVMPTFFLKKWLQNISDVLPSFGWQILCIFTLMGAILRIYFFYQKKQKMFVRVAIALFGLSFFALGAFFQKHESETRKDLAIIIVPENEVKKAPGLGTEKVSSVFGGVKILILRELGEWSLVQLPNGEKGWIEKKCFEII